MKDFQHSKIILHKLKKPVFGAERGATTVIDFLLPAKEIMLPPEIFLFIFNIAQPITAFCMIESRYAIHPSDFKKYGTEQIRQHFLIERLFIDDEIVNIYSHFDRLIVGGAKPKNNALSLQAPEELKAKFYLQRRELGIICVGETGSVSVDGTTYDLNFKDALYVSQSSRDVTFHPGKGGQALYYFNSAPAHTAYPTRKITLSEAETLELGSMQTANHRFVRKLLVNSVVKTCQLQMGLTELQQGSVWNTMPPHTHDRRMEAYFYFDLPENQMVCHFMGQSDETRHIWMKNLQAVISPPWSIHSGAGTSNYSFIWGMAGENLDYSDMDLIQAMELK